MSSFLTRVAAAPGSPLTVGILSFVTTLALILAQPGSALA